MKKQICILLLLSSSAFAGTTEDVAWCIWTEARGESTSGKKAVATVIWNRANGNSSRFIPVVWAPHQFSGMGARKNIPRSFFEQSQAGKSCFRIAKSMVNGSFRPKGPWTHFYNPSLCSPYWAKLLVNKKRVGNHVFGELK